MNNVETAILAIYIVINVFTFLAFLADKGKAKMGWWRFSETTLIVLSIFGAIGGTLGMLIGHHKVSKLKFKLVYLFFIVHVVIIALILSGKIVLPF